MTWSQAVALEQRKKALFLLLDESGGEFTRSLDWHQQDGSGIPDGVWSLLLQEGFVSGNVVGGAKWRLTVDGWIEACRLMQHEIGLDKRFGVLSAHLKAQGDRNNVYTTAQVVARDTGLNWLWVWDAISGGMARESRSLYDPRRQFVANVRGYLDPAHSVVGPCTVL